MRPAVQKESRELRRRDHEYIADRFRAAEAPLCQRGNEELRVACRTGFQRRCQFLLEGYCPHHGLLHASSSPRSAAGCRRQSTASSQSTGRLSYEPRGNDTRMALSALIPKGKLK